MAMLVQPKLIGVDVSQSELVLYDGGRLESILNQSKTISQWLKRQDGPICIAVEATNVFHLELVEQAYRRGHTVYVIDGYRLNRYRESVGGRAKTDETDARLLRRYLEREQADLRPWTPPPPGYTAAQQILRRRAVLVSAKVALEQSLKPFKELKSVTRPLLRQLARLDLLLTKRLQEAIEAHGWGDDVRRCRDIEGVGPVTACALVMSSKRGRFKNSDAFIAFLGMDVRVRDSGTMHGRRKLTKKGDPELRRLLYLAAMRASHTKTWFPLYSNYLARGFKKTQALVALARKLARIAFTLIQKQATYDPLFARRACIAA